jgi:hypothetical protein
MEHDSRQSSIRKLLYLPRARGSCVRGWVGGPSVPSELIIKFGGRPSAALLAAMEANLVTHMAYLPSLLPGSSALDAPNLELLPAARRPGMSRSRGPHACYGLSSLVRPTR